MNDHLPKCSKNAVQEEGPTGSAAHLCSPHHRAGPVGDPLANRKWAGSSHKRVARFLLPPPLTAANSPCPGEGPGTGLTPKGALRIGAGRIWESVERTIGRL